MALVAVFSCEKLKKKSINSYASKESSESGFSNSRSLQTSYTLDEFANNGIGVWHNQGVLEFANDEETRALIESFENHTSLTHSDSLAILTFVKNKVVNFLTEVNLNVSGQNLTSYIGNISDENLFFITKNSVTSPTSIVPFYNNVYNVIDLHSQNQSLLESKLDSIVNVAEGSLNPSDMLSFRASVTIGKHSNSFWNTTNYPEPSNHPIGWITADVQGAIAGGTLGSVAGPVGTIAVGVAGGLIGSCTEYLLDRVFTKIFG